MKLLNPLNEGFIPNQPDMRTKTFTQTILIDSNKMRKKASMGVLCISFTSGAPSEKKSACTNNTKNIANMRSNSMFDCLGGGDIAVICV